MRYRVISIGTLACNHLWDETQPVRTGHATTTLIQADDATILVDPGLPGVAVTAHLAERAGIKAQAITHVFLTSFQPDTCRGIVAFENAQWWISESEREAVGSMLIARMREAHDADDDELCDALGGDIAILERCRAAPDRLVAGVDLFPLPGVTPGCTGLIISQPATTTLICGDAIPTVEHLEKGSVLKHASDVMQARESFGEAVEIADLLILGRDNITANPARPW
ncbi:MAG: MBL fold metallo-hydrolase [Phycisphaerales bacterium]|nr:MBL fold metallo-hydrolase [Phycisphaerales bacterium]